MDNNLREAVVSNTALVLQMPKEEVTDDTVIPASMLELIVVYLVMDLNRVVVINGCNVDHTVAQLLKKLERPF